MQARIGLVWLAVALAANVMRTTAAIVELQPSNRPPIAAVLKNANGEIVATSDGKSDATAASSGTVSSPPPPVVPLGTSFLQPQQPSKSAMQPPPYQAPGSAPPAPRPPLGPPTDGCTGLLANVPLNCPDYQSMIAALGSNLNPSQEEIQAAATKFKPPESCCSAWRGFYAAHDGKRGCACSNSILSQSTAYGVSQAAFEQVYKAVSKSCAYLGGTYASGFYNNKCPKIIGYN